MSVLIKGMKMPKHCWQCYFHDEADVCEMLGLSCMRVWGEEKTLPDCPLIELPDHGRLIDADDIMAELGSGEYWWETEHEVPGLLNEIPTIIPAERSEE